MVARVICWSSCCRCNWKVYNRGLVKAHPVHARALIELFGPSPLNMPVESDRSV